MRARAAPGVPLSARRNQPLLEIYATASFADDAGMTGVGLPDAGILTRSLEARPSVSRSGTRFVIAGQPRGSEVVEVFDVTGRLVRRLETRNGEATWNAENAHGVRVPAGVYFGRVSGLSASVRVVLLR